MLAYIPSESVLMRGGLIARLNHNTLRFTPVDGYRERFRHLNDANLVGLIHRWLRIEPFHIYHTLIAGLVDGEVAHTEGGEILEEVGAL